MGFQAGVGIVIRNAPKKSCRFFCASIPGNARQRSADGAVLAGHILAVVKQATDISEVSQALSPQPLIESVDFQRFYNPRFENRESDATEALRLELSKSFRAAYFQRLLTGHSGTGKSTEITRLTLALQEKFEFIRLSAQDEISPFSAQPFDLLEVMAVRLVERARDLELDLPANLLERLQQWFAEVTETKDTSARLGAGVEAEAGASTPALLRSVLNLGARVKGEAKYSSARTEETVRKRLQRLSELTDLSNDLYLESNRRLLEKHHREWVFVVEDLDKNSVAEQIPEQLFVRYSNLWTGLRVHFLCTIPLWLAFGDKGTSLPFGRRSIVDIPVFGQKHEPYEPGRQILRGVLERRMTPVLFADGVRERLIQAAGGNLRDTFEVIKEAATYAELSEKQQIEDAQADRAINWLRNEYMRRLGTASSENAIPYAEKAKVLVAIYHEAGDRVVQDPVLYQLLRARVVHEYNDSYWYGLPPMVVDILIQQGHLPAGSKGGLEPYTP